MKRVVFDIETEAFSEAFWKAETTQQRRRHAPKMRLACIYREWTRTHHYFLPDEAD
jgi:hypothetical protein